MASDKQIEANKENAKKSTGPKTAASKNRVSKNAIKHGLLSADVVLPSEDRPDFDNLYSELNLALKPETKIEEVLVKRIVSTTWRLQRIQRIETGLMARQRFSQEHEDASETLKFVDRLYENQERRERNDAQNEQADTTDLPERTESSDPQESYTVAEIMQERASLGVLEAIQNENSELPKLASDFSKVAEHISLLHRYEASLEKSLYKAMHELERLQAARMGQHVPLPVAVDVYSDIGNSLS